MVAENGALKLRRPAAAKMGAVTDETVFVFRGLCDIIWASNH